MSQLLLASITLHDWLLIIGAAFLAGMANAVAGGGSFFVFPALIAAGLPSIEANITTSVAILPAGFASAFAYRAELRVYARRIVPMGLLGAIGGVSGGILLIWLGNDGFQPLVPWLLAFATIIFAISGQVRRWVAPFVEDNSRAARVLAYAFMALVAVYGGFFGAGASIMLLAALAILESGDFHRANSMKVFVGVCAITPVAIFFAMSGYVRWLEALVIAIVSIFSGYFGVAIARLVSERIVRWVVVAVGAGLTVIFFLKPG